MYKACRGCFVLKSLKSFNKRTSHKDQLDYYCYYCKRAFETVRRYKISFLDFERMRMEQTNKCKICSLFSNPLHIDHDHTTGRVRGLLCTKCNKGIGMFNDRSFLLQSAIEYLKSG